MKNPIQKLRRFFVRSRTYNAAAAARAATQTPHEEDDGGNRLSGAFIVVLVLHVIAVVGVFAFARIKENRSSSAPQIHSAQAAAPKNAPAKPAAAKTAATATVAAANPQPIAQHDAPKNGTPAIHTTHVVKEGETLTKIATQYSTGVSDFVSLNKLRSQDDIHKGQALAVPAARQQQRTPAPPEIKPAQTAAQKTTPAPAEHRTPKTYIVRKGDTPLKIAREHGCTYDELMKVNSIRDPKKIQTGQVLKLPVKNG